MNKGSMKMINFEEEKNRIINPKTKNYFEEPLSSFYNGNYRAAIVGLYSVTMYDLLSKIDDLAEYYSQPNAKSAIKEIKNSIQMNQESGAWEKVLIEKAKNLEGFLESSMKCHIDHLQKLRHLCAHPALDSNYDLFTPSKTETLSLMELLLSDLFIQPPLFSSKITEYLSEKIAKLKLNVDADIKYVSEIVKNTFSDYLDNMTDEVYGKVFKNFWKLAFHIHNNDCDRDRRINTLVISLMIEKRTDSVIALLGSDTRYFNNNIANDDDEILDGMCYLIYRFIPLFNKFDKSRQDFIKEFINRDPKKKTKFWMIHKTTDSYISSINIDTITYEEVKALSDIYKNVAVNWTLPQKNKLKNTFIQIYLNSGSFDSARERVNLLDAISCDITKDELLELLSKCENDRQTSWVYGYSGKASPFGIKWLKLVNEKELTGDEIRQFPKFSEMYFSEE